MLVVLLCVVAAVGAAALGALGWRAHTARRRARQAAHRSMPVAHPAADRGHARAGVSAVAKAGATRDPAGPTRTPAGSPGEQLHPATASPLWQPWRSLASVGLSDTAPLAAIEPGLAPGRRGGHCPSCRSFFAQFRFCVVDGRGLVDEAPARAHGLWCPRCQRGFPATARVCPHDDTDLVLALPAHGHPEIRVAAGDAHSTDADDRTRWLGDDQHCPVCHTRYARDARFCGFDGAKLTLLQ